jgi:hypothetical protein
LPKSCGYLAHEFSSFAAESGIQPDLTKTLHFE